jgi:hypothetical protein
MGYFSTLATADSRQSVMGEPRIGPQGPKLCPISRYVERCYRPGEDVRLDLRIDLFAYRRLRLWGFRAFRSRADLYQLDDKLRSGGSVRNPESKGLRKRSHWRRS